MRNLNRSDLQKREYEYMKGLHESQESLKLLQEKTNLNSLNSADSINTYNTASDKQQHSQKKSEQYGEQEQEEEHDEEAENLKKSGSSFVGRLLKKVGSGSLIAGGTTVGGIGVVSTLLIGMYRIHYDGEFEFKGIGAEYQNSSFKKTNFTSFDETGNITLNGLTKENKLVKAYYTYYSDNSYFAIVEDSSKYKDNMDEAYDRKNLLTPKELREKYPQIQDAEGREKMFQLNPDVLYSLDKYLHKDKAIYPQQFVKPVYYEEKQETFQLKSLTDEKGALVTKSQVFSSNGKPAVDSNGKLKRETGLWDYGLASVLAYKEYDVPERTITNVSGYTMTYEGAYEDEDTPIKKEENIDDENKILDSRSVNMVENSRASYEIPEKGAVVSNLSISKKTPPSEHPDAPSGTSEETIREEKAYAIEKAVTAGGTILGNVKQKWQEKSGSRSSFEKTYYMYDLEETDEGVILHKYKVVYTYETYQEEYVPYYEGELDTSKISGSKYYRDYIRNYSNYIPVDVPRELDYSVLENEEVSQLIYDDDPNNLNSGDTPNNGTLTEEEFNNAVFMGDSITWYAGPDLYNLIPRDRVVAYVGANTNNLACISGTSSQISNKNEEVIKEVVSKNPKVLIMTYGANDANIHSPEQFAKNYIRNINSIKEKVPGVKIILNKAFYAKSKIPNNKIDGLNAKLDEIASQTGATVVDCTNIYDVKYHADYVHFKKEFYPVWFDELKKKLVNTSVNNPINPSNLPGQTFKAEFRAYMKGEGGDYDIKGVPLDYTKNTCAVPMKSKYPNSLLEYGSQFVINGTGTFKDGTICTANDVGGGKIALSSDGTYGIDILVGDKHTENNVIGVKHGTITILNGGKPVNTARSAEVNSRSMEDVFPGNQAVRSFVSDKARTSSLMLNTGGNAVTNYSTTIDDYAKARAGGKCDSGTCSVENYKKNLEPDAFKDKVGDLRHLRLDIFRPVDETAFATKFAEKFDKKIAPYALAFINACKEKNIDVLAVVAQIALESGWGKHAIVGTIGGSTYYNFTGIGAVDGNAYNGGLNYAKKKGWDTPEKAVMGAIEFLSNEYIHSQTNQQNTLYKISFPFIGKPNGHFYASNPDYAYTLASIMNGWTSLYSSGATFYYDMPTFDPSKPAGTTEGAGHGAQVGGASIGAVSAIGAFNSYLASNWSTFLEKKEILYPWTKDLDKDLEKEMKGYYANLKDEKLAIRNKNKYTVNLTKTDEEIILNMMFALNQGNYLSKYDYMGEAEWKAMYNQLLSSPTGKTWDDKWIGYNCEDIFDMKIEDLGTLFKEGSGVNPTISRPFGKLMNIYSDDVSILPQYNETNFGIDITVPKDTEVLSIADGEVIGVGKKSEPTSRYGRYVIIQYNNNTKITIANFDKIDKKIKNGAKVKKGQVLGTTGGTCRSYKEGDLHLEVLFKDNYINPEWILTRDMKGFEDPIESNAGGGSINCGSNTPVSDNEKVNAIIQTGRDMIGKYVYSLGRKVPNSYDCSSFISHILTENGFSISQTAIGFRNHKDVVKISREELQAGDLIFWHNDTGAKHSSVYHVAMYIGNDAILECTSDPVNGITDSYRKVSELKDNGKIRYYSFGRYTPLSGGSSAPVSPSTGCQIPTNTEVADNGKYIWPLKNATKKDITSGLGGRDIGNGPEQHKGMDISVPIGSEVFASRSGKVVKTYSKCPTNGTLSKLACNFTMGNMVKIEHEDGHETIYMHLKQNEVRVSVGQNVTQGQVIGLSGNSGRSSGPHLHFQINVNGTPKNPKDFVDIPN